MRFNVTNNADNEGKYNHRFSVMGYRYYRSGGIDWNEKVIDTPTLSITGPAQAGAINEIMNMFHSSSATEIHISIHSYNDDERL